MPMPAVLLTGFEPFEGESINPSWEAVRALEGQVLEGHRVVVACLPVEFGKAGQAVEDLVTLHRPAVAVGVGQARGVTGLVLERVALNLEDARIPDNGGAQPVDGPVVPGAPTAYFTTLPVKTIRESLRRAGIPAALSLSAGTFVCNHLFFTLQHLGATQSPGLRSGFIHLPLLPSQAAGEPSMALDLMVAGLRLALETTLRD